MPLCSSSSGPYVRQSSPLGTLEDVQLAHKLASVLDQAAREAGVGECRGFYYGNSRCVVVLDGTSLDALLEAIEPIDPALQSFPRTLRVRMVEAD